MSWRDLKSWRVIARCAQPLVGISCKRNLADAQIINTIGSWALYEQISRPQSVFLDGKYPVEIFDARPRVNALGNIAGGGGFEKLEDIDANLSFLNVENIHVVREGLSTLRKLFSKTSAQSLDLINDDDTDVGDIPETLEAWAAKYLVVLQTLRKSSRATTWFPMIQTIIAGAVTIADTIVQKRSAIVHCSDGWDRTPQLTSTAQILLDPYYRTIEGFAVLIEKEWVSFGHKFSERYGHGSNRSKYQDTERSPVFIQWLDVVFQLIFQKPSSFEFKSNLLVFLACHVYSCRYGTFLFDCEK